MKNYFFIDSKSKFSVEQYAFAFENGLFSASDIEVIVKFRLGNFLRHIKAWWKYRFRLRFVLSVREGLLYEEGGCIYYFFNSIENVKLIKNRAYAHVFLGHGESNKRASLHPLYRIYDYLLVAGPYASQRLVEYGILNQVTASERVLDIGGAGVANVEFKDLMVIGNGGLSVEPRALLYMPTWEGGLDEENYSTLDDPSLPEFLLETAKKFSVDSIFIKPHSNTGSRIKHQKMMLADLIKKLEDKGLKVFISKKDFSILPFLQRRGLGARKCATTENQPRFSCAIVDVSAAESMAAKRGVPSIIVASRRNGPCAPEAYESLKGNSVIRLESWASMKDCSSHAYLQAQSNYQRDYIEFFRNDDNEKFKRAIEHIKVDLDRKLTGTKRLPEA